MTMKSIRGVLCRYFKTMRCIDLIANESFINANNIFQSVQNANKEVGLGVIKSYPPLDDCDLRKIKSYFEESMAAPPNPKSLPRDYNILYTLLHV